MILGVSGAGRGVGARGRKRNVVQQGQIPNLALLPTSGTRNPSSYDSSIWYNANGSVNGSGQIRSMPTGCYYLDPVTGVRVWKVTGSTTPEANSRGWNLYSTQGLHISQRWGSGNYTCAIILDPDSSAKPYLFDFNRTQGPHNWRSAAGLFDANGSMAFSRVPGEERIFYSYRYTTPRRIYKYDTSVAGTPTEVTDGTFPYTWTGPDPFWFQQSDDGTWFTAQINGSAVYAVRPSTGTTRVLSATGMDEHYMGTNNTVLVAVAQNGTGAGILWNLDTNAQIIVNVPAGSHIINHVPALTGAFLITDTETGGGRTPIRRLTHDGTLQASVDISGQYFGQYHWCGHWRNGSGDQQYALVSLWQDTNPPNTVGNFPLSLAFVRADGGDVRVLGHTYSNGSHGTTPGYYGMPQATQPPDGTLVMFNSSMNLDANTNRADVFIAEVPLG